MEINLSLFIYPFDGNEDIKIRHHNSKKTMFEGKKIYCPYFDVIVVGLWTENGKIIIDVV